MEDNIYSIVRKAEQNLISGTTKLGKYVNWSMHETLEKIFAYLNSTHTTGSQDSLGRDKPFFNIVTAAVNIWYRATDIDRKDITILPDKVANTIPAFVASIYLQEWMKKTGFGTFLNQWGRILAAYGSAVVKFVEKDGELITSVIPWNRLIVDAVDFNSLPRIEKFYKTPAQLQNMAKEGHPDYAGYDPKVVEDIINARESRDNLDRQQIDNMNEFIELYEVHGELSMATYKQAKGDFPDDKDNNEYFQQMHVVTWVKNQAGNYSDFTLYSGKEKRDPYMITHLIEEDGRSLAIGAVEYLFDAQWMQNHTIKAWKDQMDLASKLVFQTADQAFIGRNVLTSIETGDILHHQNNQPLELLPNTGHDITSLQAFSAQWKVLEREVTSTADAVRGTVPPSGTPLGTTQIVTAQSLSLFEMMTENKGLALETMLREFIIPFIKRKLNNKDEIVSALEDRDLKKIDSLYIPREAAKRFNDKVKESLLAGQLPEADLANEEQGVRNELSTLGNQRFISPGDINWSDALKDLEWEVDVAITNEMMDKQAQLQTLSTILQTIAQVSPEDAKIVIRKMLEKTGTLSPIELPSLTQPMAQPSPIQQPQLPALTSNP